MKYLSLLLMSIWFFSCTQKQEVRIHILGDSTTEEQNQHLKDQRGWAQMLHHFFTDNVTILNHGKSGASSRSFYEGKWWINARKTIQPRDYVVIQFGHNDEKDHGFNGEIGTVATESYQKYLQKFVDEIKDLGGIPIFATPIVRKMGREGELVSRRSSHDLAEYVAANIDQSVNPADTISFNYSYNMKQVAIANGCPVVDMTASTVALVNKLGFETATRRIYNFGDGTHICAEGALLFSKLFVDELKEKEILSDYIVENPEIIIQPGKVDLGEVVRHAEYRQEIDLMKLTEEKQAVSFRVEAGDGVLVSEKEYGEYVTVIDLLTEFDVVYYRQIYIKVMPESEGIFASSVTINDGKKKYVIPVQGNVVDYRKGQAVSVKYPLTGNPKPVVTGPVLAIEHTLSGLERTSFNYLGADGLGAHLDPPVTFRVEWLNIVGGKWPQNEIDVVSDRYAQFGIRAGAETPFHLENIVLSVGGGVNYRIQVSTDPAFGDYTVIGEGKGLELTKFEVVFNQTLNEGEIFYLRIYPWQTMNQPDQQLCLSNIAFEGKI